ncbi:S-layer homology domain-containing protein [Aeromicrobium ponti]|uniref:S-layer homology domain-containing protein n=1 Tax=Cytobacillus oceanisediminis TaxID=665099 RepID=UPI0011A6865B|nr:S-layer homology domain-containing protein [Cytobacillus oceanisediminis]
MKKARLLLLAFVLLFTAFPAAGYAADDITGIQLEEELREAIDREIMYGYGEGIYKPELKVTRGEFANFISRALKLPSAEHKFPDVAITSSLAPGINSAAEAGIIAGQSDGNFNPDKEITREQMVIMIKNALDYKNMKVDYEVPAQLTDFDKITSSTSRVAIAASVTLQITIGFPNSDGTTYRFEAQRQASRAEAAAFIVRMIHAMEDFESQLPGEPGEPEIEKPYVISTINENRELVETTKAYETYKEAETAWNSSSSEVITFNGKVIKMQSGLVYASPSIGNATTYLYSSESLSSVEAAVPPQEELKFLGSTETTVKVYIGGRTAYVKQSEVNMVPAKMVTKQNYYTVNTSGELVYRVYSPATDKYGAFEVGKAPSFLKQGQNYYSWDGTKFYTNPMGSSTSFAGQYYPYHQFLSARTKTSYTAAELDQFIDRKLAELEATGAPAYKDATKVSKVKGLGTYLKKVEAESNVNALLVLGWAFHESQYGMSANALKLNNLFGIEAYDSNPSGAVAYPTPTGSVDALVNKYLNKAYIPQGDWRSNGAAPGNKLFGFNVRYATDAYWGAKISGHMYRIEKALGFKDYTNKKVIGLINTNGTNVRTSPSSSQGTANLLYTYKTAIKPVVIVEEVKSLDGDSWTWYKILSDANGTQYGYVRRDLIDKVVTN